jgi:mannose-6-phosphate isomerase-like protein (cupin superfamily)
MEKKPVRRIVTGHDANGKSVVLFDGATPHAVQHDEGDVISHCWITNETPVDLSHTRDQAGQKVGVSPPKNGSICRVVDFAPLNNELPEGVDHHEILRQMGIDPATQGYVRHPFTHRTRSIDYAIVLEGEIDMLLDDSEVHLRAGDILVQQGTNHAWVNRSGQLCRVCFVLIDSLDPSGWNKRWEPKAMG